MTLTACIKGMAHAGKHGIRSSARAVNWMLRAVSPDRLTAGLHKAGIAQGDTLLVHSAFDGMRFFKGNPLDALEALLAVVGPEGTLAMPAFSFAGRSYDYLMTRPVFDVRRTPARTGILCEILRRKPGALRSLHPTHSVVAFGLRAGHITGGHENAITPFDQASPWARLMEVNAWMLCIGTNPRLLPVTPYHHFDELMNDRLGVRIYHEVPFCVPVRDGQGTERTLTTYAHDPQTGKFRDYDRLCHEQIRAGLLKHCRIGAIHMWAGRMQDLYASVRELADRGITAYSSRPA